MLIEAALALEIQTVNPRLPTPTVTQYVQWVVEDSRHYDVDPWVVYALVGVESHWNAAALRREGDGTCSVGLGQINVRDCYSEKVVRLLEPRANLRAVVLRLNLLQRVCSHDCDGIGWLQGYNPGSHHYLGLVTRLMRRRGVYEDRESDIREVHTEMYSSGMCRQGDS